MQKINICFFNSNKEWGGGEKWHLNSAFQLKEKGYKILIAANKNSELGIKAKKINIDCKKIHVSNLSFLNIFKILSISRFFKKNKIDVVVLNLPNDVKTAGIAAKIAGVKKIIYRRGSAIPIKNSLSNKLIFKYIIDKIIANSEETKRTLLAGSKGFLDKKMINVIYNGLDINKFDDYKPKALYQRIDKEIIFGSAGRLNKQKGQKYLIELAKKLDKKNIDFKILIAGKGELKDDLIKYAEKSGVKSKIKFIGFVENIQDFIESIDIFLLPSIWEGFGYVIAEAMAKKRPVVAFNISSNSEIIENNKTGFLIKPFDIDEFSEKVQQLILNKALRTEFGEAGRKKIEKEFNQNDKINELVKLIES
ncbi:MAG: glycosyltransferase [Bacteroidales bacterium]|nr:glycosyltransferase [Bacteroidales bacterium]